jgi:6-phosphogluconate dehydrogenase
MGGAIAARLREHGHSVVGFDADPALSDVASLHELADRLPSPRIAWLMLPAGSATEQSLATLAAHFQRGDLIIDGGNSYYRDSVRRAAQLAEKGIGFLDVGTSGGIWGREHGFCLMAGGNEEAFQRAEPVFRALAQDGGYAHLGGPGAGHYAKMVHNGIEYGMLQALAEGFDLLHAAGEYAYDLERVASLWTKGSVVRGWLLDLAVRAFSALPQLDHLQGFVEDSGEGRWTVLEGVERGVDVSVLSRALFARFNSRDQDRFAMRLIAALRNEFGGHATRPA